MLRPLLILASFGLITGTAQARPAISVRVMSYNVRVDVDSDDPRWADRKGPMVRQIAFVDPDLLGVQESRPQAVDDLALGLPGYSHYGLGRDDGKIGESATLFWRTARFAVVAKSTQWCSPTPKVPSKGWDAAFPRTITRVILRDRKSGRLLDVRNSHFDHVGVVARENCARQIEATPRYKGAAIIVLGDFNSGPDSAPYHLLSDDKGLNLKDARMGAAVDFGPTGTFNAFDIKGGDQAIDHVFVDRALTVSKYAVLTDTANGKVISDHFPVVADVNLTNSSSSH